MREGSPAGLRCIAWVSCGGTVGLRVAACGMGRRGRAACGRRKGPSPHCTTGGKCTKGTVSGVNAQSAINRHQETGGWIMVSTGKPWRVVKVTAAQLRERLHRWGWRVSRGYRSPSGSRYVWVTWPATGRRAVVRISDHRIDSARLLFMGVPVVQWVLCEHWGRSLVWLCRDLISATWRA